MSQNLTIGNKKQKEGFSMCTNWKGFTLKVIVLASLALFLYGCSSIESSPSVPASKTISGVVSDKTTGQIYANATVIAYAVDAAGNVSAAPLSIAAVQSDGQGNFVLKIPELYTGGILLKAIYADSTFARAVLPSSSQSQPVIIGLASEMVTEYIATSPTMAGKYTPDNIQKSILVLEPFLGNNFTQTAPPAIGTSTTVSQQQLIVVTQAINSLTSPTTTLASLLTVQPDGVIQLGQATTLTTLNAAISTTSATLIDTGVVPGTLTTPTVAPPVKEQDLNLTDTTPPAAPQAATPVATANSVSLAWNAAQTADGVTAYYIYRNGVFIGSTGVSILTFVDSSVNSATTYTYEIRARDAAGNLSAAGSVTATTSTIPTYTISGKVTLNGTGLASVFVFVSGTGTGVVVTDANGDYSVPSVRAGSYTIAPSSTGYTFTPESRTVDITSASATGIDFTATAVTPGSVTGGVTYPPGTIVGGITYPTGTVINGVTYPTATVIGGVTYPTGTVIGGITYPNGVVIGGVSYPAGTVVGGVAFPLGTVTTGFTAPSGTVIGGVIYPTGTVTGGVINPTGTAIGTVTYPTGTVIGGVVFPTGMVNGALTYSSGSIIPVLSTTYKVIVSGRIVDGGGVGLVGVPISISGAGGGSTTTGSMGYYYISVVSGGTYTITPPAVPYTLNSITYTTLTFTPHLADGITADAGAVTTITPTSNLDGRDFTYN